MQEGEIKYTVVSALPIERKFLSPIVRALIFKTVGVTGYISCPIVRVLSLISSVGVTEYTFHVR